jgi:single-strand DNA-binding protein
MKGLNKVTLIGNLGNDPEILTLESGSVLAKFNMATNESYRDEKGELITNTEWHNVLLWGNLALNASKFLKKGSLLYLEGKLKTRSYTDKEGIKRYVTEIIGDSFILLDKA